MNTPGDVAISKTQRWLDLIAFLVKHRFPVPVDEVMEGVPAYRSKYRTGDDRARAALHRMFERDKDELRAAGIPIRTLEYTIEQGDRTVGYQLEPRDFYLPYLRLVEEGAPVSGVRATSGVSGLSRPMDLGLEDAHTALDGLRRVRELPASPFADDARSALTKLTFDLDPDAVPGAPVLYAETEEARTTRDTLRLLTDALRRRARVTFRYHGIHRGEATDRDVAPHGLLFQHAHWYLIGADATRDGGFRVFRLGRMEDVQAGQGGAAEYEFDPDFDLQAYVGRRPWELGDDEPLEAEVRFEFPLSLWAERNGHGTKVAEEPGGAVVRRFHVRQTDPFLRWLQGFAGDAVVTAPPQLRQAQADLARATLAVYGEDPDAPGEDPGAPGGEAHG